MSHIVRGSKVVVSIFRTLKRYNMATTTKFISAKIFKVR